MLQRRLLDHRKAYRSVKYRINRNKNTKTADPSSNNFRIKRNSCMESTMAKTYGSQFPAINLTIDLNQSLCQKTIQKPTYLQSFNSLMDTSEQNINKRKIKVNKFQSLRQRKQIQFFRESKEIIREKDRIQIPFFKQIQKQVQNSEHHLLAPFNAPYSHVHMMALNAETELKSQKNQVQLTKGGFRELEKKTLRSLQEITNHVNEQIMIMRKIIRKNQVEQQEKKLKSKRQIQQMQKKHNHHLQKFQEIHNRNSGLQFTIFNSTPYNLIVQNLQDQEFQDSKHVDLVQTLKDQKEDNSIIGHKKVRMFYI